MSKRRKRKRKKPDAGSAAPPKFALGEKVRVKTGVYDDDFPDLPMGGWAGTVREVGRNGIYTVRWRRDTLENIHPVYRKRCAIEGLIFEEYRLSEDELEPDPGGRLQIQQPSEIRPRPLSATKQGDRVRMVFGLTSDDYLPRVSEESLEVYYDYLEERLRFPFDARYEETDSFPQSFGMAITVTGLGSDMDWKEDEGLRCEVQTTEGETSLPLTELTLRRSSGQNYRLIADYTAWFLGNLQEDLDDDETDFDDEALDESILPVSPPTRLGIAWLHLQIVLFGICFGAVIGSAVAVMPWAKWGAAISGGLWGLFIAVSACLSAQPLPPLPVAFRRPVAGLVGLLTGALQGAFIGVAIVAFLGALAGLVVAIFVGPYFGPVRKEPRFSFFPGSLFTGPAVGIVAQAFYLDSSLAAIGFRQGMLAGLGGGLIGAVLLFAIVVLAKISD